MDLSPDEHYKKRHVIPGGFIPGPNKPKNIDSFLFPGLHHLSALQREGLSIWDAYENRHFVCNLYIGLNTADGPGMAYLNGLVGHHGKYGCRLYCSVPGRHKPNGPHYYPALLKPDNYVMDGCDHEDISHFDSGSISLNWYINNLQHLLSLPNDTQYKKRRLETGITKPTIFLGVPNNRILGIPGCFGSDWALTSCISVHLTFQIYFSHCGVASWTAKGQTLSHLGPGQFFGVQYGSSMVRMSQNALLIYLVLLIALPATLLKK